MKTLFQYVLKHKFFVLLTVLLVLGGVYFSSGKKASPYETTQVKKTDIIQEVSVTGRVNSETLVDLAFEKGGRVSGAPTLVGTHVTKGTPLIRLDASELTALRAQASANLDYEVANLAQLNSGVRKEDVAISESKLAGAQVTLNNALLGVVDKIRGAYPIADDAVRNQTDVLWRNPRTTNPELNVSVTDGKLATDLPQRRINIENQLRMLENISLTISTNDDSTILMGKLVSTENALSLIKEYLNILALAMGSVVPTSSISQTTIDTYKSGVTVARTSVVGTLTGLLGVDVEVRVADSAVKIVANELALKKSGPTNEALAAEVAKVASVRATLANYDAQLEKAILRAPFAGVVTRNDAKTGETVTPNAGIVSLMSDGVWKIEANVPEVDVAKIKIGNNAKATLDAYGSDVKFDATVSLIDPAETILEGVSTYKITLHFNEADNRIRSGMTANMNIATNKREGVLGVPLRAVTTKDNKKFVRTLTGDIVTEKEVELGLRGSDGQVEIMGGLHEGETVITFEKAK